MRFNAVVEQKSFENASKFFPPLTRGGGMHLCPHIPTVAVKSHEEVDKTSADIQSSAIHLRQLIAFFQLVDFSRGFRER